MTKNEMWQKVHEMLMSEGMCLMEIDGYSVQLEIGRISLLKSEILVYVNGLPLIN